MGLTVPKIKTYSYGTPMAPVVAAPRELALVGLGGRCNMLQERVQAYAIGPGLEIRNLGPRIGGAPARDIPSM